MALSKAQQRRINQLQSRDLDKSQIVARLTGTRDGGGAAKQLSVAELRAIGFSDNFISRVKPNWEPPRPKPTGGGKAEAGKGGNPGKNPAAPEEPGFDYGEWLSEQENQRQFKYNQNAADALAALFDTYGLGGLSGRILGMLQEGMSEAAIVAELRETPEYKKRFPGMKALRDNGYNAISEAEYLQLEDSYHAALQGSGLPPGFYDQPEDFVKFISNGVDPSEVKARAQAATDMVNQVDPSQRELLSSMYGVGSGDLAAYFLDPKKAMPLLQKQLATVGIANAAKKAGIGQEFVNRQRFESLVDNGVSVEAAAQGYAQIAEELDPLKNLSRIWGNSDWGIGEAEQATFYGNAGARKKRKGLIDRERAAFSGRSGFDSRVSGRGSSAGAF